MLSAGSSVTSTIISLSSRRWLGSLSLTGPVPLPIVSLPWLPPSLPSLVSTHASSTNSPTPGFSLILSSESFTFPSLTVTFPTFSQDKSPYNTLLDPAPPPLVLRCPPNSCQALPPPASPCSITSPPGPCPRRPDKGVSIDASTDSLHRGCGQPRL